MNNAGYAPLNNFTVSKYKKGERVKNETHLNIGKKLLF